MAKAPKKQPGKVGQHDQLIPLERWKSTARWQKSYGMFITGQTLIDEVTMLADEMERRWGAGRLRLIVGPDLREKFDRQRYMFNQAIWHGELEDVRLQCQRMMNAWRALDKEAVAAGKTVTLPEVWDIVSPEGYVYAIVRNKDDAKQYQKDGRPVILMSLEEIAVILDAQRPLQSVKEAFPGAEVVEYQDRAVGCLLGEIWDTEPKLEDPLDDDIPF